MALNKILVTGGAGFIGSYVIEQLLEEGFKVLVLDHSAPGTLSTIAGREGVEIFLGDVRDPVVVTEAVAHVDGIIHLAAVLGTQETIGNPIPATMTNVIGGLNILEAAVQYDVPVVYAGVGNYWMREYGAGTYTITKTVIEDFAKMYNLFRGGKITVVRPVNAYGARQSVAAPYGSSKVRKIMPSFICRALAGDDIEIYGDGTQVSDCVHVIDVARTFVTALRYTHGKGAALNALEVGPTTSLTINEIATLVIDEVEMITGKRVGIVHLPMRPGEVPNATVSSERDTLKVLEDKFNSIPFITLQDGIRDTVHWFANSWLPEYERNGQ